jgi:hypothetical protein
MAAYELLDFAPRNYKRPQTEGSITKLTSLAENDGHEMTTRNLDDLVDEIFENSMVEIESLIDEFERLRTKLRTSREPTGDGTYGNPFRKRGGISSISGSTSGRTPTQACSGAKSRVRQPGRL